MSTWDQPLKRRGSTKSGAPAVPPKPREPPARRVVALAREEEWVRTAVSGVVGELRRLDSVARRERSSAAQASRMRELRVQEGRLHAELSRIRGLLAAARRELAAEQERAEAGREGEDV